MDSKIEKRLRGTLRLLKLDGSKKDYTRGINLVRKNIRIYPGSLWLKRELAFFLYHYAASIHYRKTSTGEERKKAKKYFDEAIRICRYVIAKEDKKSLNYLNTRFFLAQIYAMLGYKRAIAFAKENYRTSPNFVTSNRLADVYDRLGKDKEALRWYKISERYSKKEKSHPFGKVALAIFYKKLNKQKLAEKYAREILRTKPRGLNGKVVVNLIKKNFPRFNIVPFR